MNRIHRIIATAALAILMMASALPVTAFAAEIPYFTNVERLSVASQVSDDFQLQAGLAASGDDDAAITSSERNTYRLYAVIGSLVLALLVAFIVTGVWKGQLKSVRKQNFAHAYVREGSLKITRRGDVFLHRRVQKTQRQTK